MIAARSFHSILGAVTFALPLAIGIANPPLARAQTSRESKKSIARDAPGSFPRYEVVSIKPTGNQVSSEPGGYKFYIEPNGALSATGITLRRLMMTAFNVQGFRILGGPGWISSRQWDVQAKPDRAASPDQVRPMLRTLLEDRFRVRTHTETRSLPIYVLVIDRNGSKVPTAQNIDSKPTIQVAPGLMRLTNAASSTFASQLSYALGYPVIDNTNLSGRFDFALTWTPEPGEDGGPTTAGLPPGTAEAAPSVVDGPSVFTAIREQLGLRLESRRAPVEVFAIDDVQLPTEN